VARASFFFLRHAMRLAVRSLGIVGMLMKLVVEILLAIFLHPIAWVALRRQHSRAGRDERPEEGSVIIITFFGA